MVLQLFVCVQGIHDGDGEKVVEGIPHQDLLPVLDKVVPEVKLWCGQ